jgi:hypothetical protein
MSLRWQRAQPRFAEATWWSETAINQPSKSTNQISPFKHFMQVNTLGWARDLKEDGFSK